MVYVFALWAKTYTKKKASTLLPQANRHMNIVEIVV